MSNHICKAVSKGTNVIVTIGWDRPLQGFFMDVKLEKPKLGEYEYLYSSIDDDKVQFMPSTLDPFLLTLAKLGVAVPNEMLQAVLADQENNVGNKVVNY
jgi:hypothetical protein